MQSDFCLYAVKSYTTQNSGLQMLVKNMNRVDKIKLIKNIKNFKTHTILNKIIFFSLYLYIFRNCSSLCPHWINFFPLSISSVEVISWKYSKFFHGILQILYKILLQINIRVISHTSNHFFRVSLFASYFKVKIQSHNCWRSIF